jgi:hypothetical protein
MNEGAIGARFEAEMHIIDKAKRPGPYRGMDRPCLRVKMFHVPARQSVEDSLDVCQRLIGWERQLQRNEGRIAALTRVGPVAG